MVGTLATAKRAAIEGYVSLCKPVPRRLRRQDRQGDGRCAPRSDREHVLAAVRWICRAQDATPDGGVAAMYSLVEGWKGSYPETTGYIIPALYEAIGWLNPPATSGQKQTVVTPSKNGLSLPCLPTSQGESQGRCSIDTSCGSADSSSTPPTAGTISIRALQERIARMADWLLETQLADGAFPGSFAGQFSPGRVFNTGQVIFGLLRAGVEQGTPQHIEAARRAGDWLLACQDDDGAWRTHTLNSIPHTYNTRTAWALARLAEATGERRYRDAAVANCEWALTQQLDTGWFSQNGFGDGSAALLHTIAYAIRGLLEVGALSGQDRFISAARRAADGLYAYWQGHHCMGGAFVEDWSVPVSWRCLPGEAQIAIDFLRLDQLTGDEHYRPAAVELLEQTKAAQFLDEHNPDFHGGLSGSFPINGDYERYCLVNWGPKFLIDALILKGAANRA